MEGLQSSMPKCVHHFLIIQETSSHGSQGRYPVELHHSSFCSRDGGGELIRTMSLSYQEQRNYKRKVQRESYLESPKRNKPKPQGSN
ncbi:hypothetical protein YC2023_001783 [Brassica napus]